MAVREAPELIPTLIRLIYSIIEKRECYPTGYDEKRLEVAESAAKYGNKKTKD